MNYKKRDDELIKLNKQVQNMKNSATSKSLSSQKSGTYGSTRKEVPYVKPNKASEMNTTGNVTTKPSTRYQNQTAGQTAPKKTRDTRYDKDFDEFHKYRLGDFSGAMDYDPVTDTSTEHWRTMKNDLMKKHGWSEEEFDTRWNSYNDERNKKASEQEVQTAVKTAKDNALLGTALQAMYTPQTWIEGGASMLSNLLPEKYKAQSADAANFTGIRTKEATKQAVKDEHIKGDGLLAKAGRGAYDVGTSLVDMALASGVPVLGAATMGAETAARTNMEALERGASANRAAATAGISGLVSGAMNKIGLDKAAGAEAKTALGKVIKGAGVEAAENMLEDSANLAVDTLINTDKSQLSALHDYYTSQGLDDKSAWNRVMLDTARDMAVSGVSGAAFGGVMNGLHNLPSLIPEVRDLTKGLKMNDVGGVDAPALLEEARAAMKAPAKVGNKLEFEPVEGEPNRIPEPTGESAPTNIEPTADTQPINSTDEIKDYHDRRAALLSEIANPEHTTAELDALYRQIGDLDEEMIQRHPELFDADGNLKEEGTAEPIPEQSNVSELTAEEQAEIQNELAEEYDWTDNRVPEVTQPTSENVPPTNEPPTVDSMIEPPIEGRDRKDIRKESRVGTHSAVNSGIFTEDQVHNDPVISELNKYIPKNEQESYDNALMNVAQNGDELLDDYINGKRTIDNDRDVDQSMILLTMLSNRLNAGDTSVEAQRNLLFGRLRQAGTKYGQTIQAFAKWNRTAEGAIANGESIIGDTVKKWKGKNKKSKEFNGRIAKALAQMGYDGSMDKKPVVKTHEQIREGVKNVIEREFGSIEGLFSDKDIDVLTNWAEEGVPTWKITDEIEHFLNHGEWYTLDESTPVKKAFSSKLNTVLKNMGDDRLKEANRPLNNGYGKSHATIVEEVRNSLEKEMAGVGLDKPADIEFLATMIEEGVPNWQIEDEIRHRLDTGEWYSLDESIEPKYPVNQRLKNALDSLVDNEPAPVKEPPTLDEIRNQVRATLDEEYANRRETGDFTDEDVEYLANLINEGATKEELADALNTKMATGRFGISAETQQAVSDMFRYANKFDLDSQKAYELRTAAYKLLANEAVSEDATAFEKFDSWRYLAMLGNPRTWVRNKVGNEMFNVVTGISNNLSAALEVGADKAYRAMGGEGIQRTKAFLNPVDDRGLIKAATEDGDNHRYSALRGEKYERGVKDAIRQQKSVFNSKALRAYEAATDWGISDYKNVKKKYGTSLAGYMKANGLDESSFDADNRYRDLLDKSRSQLLTDAEKTEMNMLKPIYDELEKARDYAVKQAEYATFHEDNAFAKWWTESSKKAPGPVGLIMEGVLPFKKTPANILNSGLHYSPLGAIHSIAKTGKLIYENTGKRKGNLEDTYTGKNWKGKDVEINKTLASEVLDSWSKTATGSLLVGLGFYLKNKGIINSSNKDEKYQDQLEGKQNYSITINGHTYTLDWAAPAVMPLLMGAELSKIKDRNTMLNQKWYDNMDELVGTVNAILDPMFETSMLSGVKDTMEQVANDLKYDDKAAIGGILGSAAFNTLTGYATQGIPTLSGQIARTVDNTRRSTDTKNEGLVGVLERQGRKIMNKIPGLSRMNQPYYDAYGRTQTNGPKNPLGNLAYQMLSPGYLQKINTTPADEAARNAYYALGEPNEEGERKPIMNKDVFPSWKSKVTVNGEKYTPEQMATYRKTSGEAQYAIRDALAKNDWFNNLSGEKQTDLLKKVNTLVDKIGKDANGDGSDDEALDLYKSKGVPGLVDYWHGQDTLKNFRDETGISTSANAYKELKALYEDGNFAEADKRAAEVKKNDADRQKYNAENGTSVKLADWEKNYSGKVTTTNKTATTTKATQTTNKVPEVKTDTAKEQKYVDRAGKQSRKYTNDIPKIESLNFSSSQKYTYAYAINQDTSLTPEKFDQQYDKMDLDKNGSMKQDEMITYFNNNNVSQDQGQYLWKTYGENKGKAWKAVPVLSNGTWKKKK